MKYYFSILMLLSTVASTNAQQKSKYINTQGKVVQNRILVPNGYKRMQCAEGSFGAYLQNMPLMPDGSKVHYYNGREKENNGIYVAVVDMNIGNKDLQQCADVIMHARAEYLYKTHQIDKIHFKFTSGFVASYSKWIEGYRIAVSGNNVKWVKIKPAADNNAIFLEYMDVIYNYCGTLSLSKELKKISYTELQPGDVIIKGGSPGHAELVMDMCLSKSGGKIYLLSQSYMPAQQMQILANPTNKELSPWYELKGTEIITPEWDFTADQVMRFVN